MRLIVACTDLELALTPQNRSTQAPRTSPERDGAELYAGGERRCVRVST
jgi:hypothetical protein